MKRFSFVVAIVVGIIGSGFAIADKKNMLEGVKCVVAGTAAAKEENAVDYREGKVYFCCTNCPKKFEKDKAAFATKANHQLVATKQYEQTACPFSGNKLDTEKNIEVAGTKVSFCCDGCKAKAEKMKDDEKLESVFSEKAFAKAKFVKVEAKK